MPVRRVCTYCFLTGEALNKSEELPACVVLRSNYTQANSVARVVYESIALAPAYLRPLVLAFYLASLFLFSPPILPCCGKNGNASSRFSAAAAWYHYNDTYTSRVSQDVVALASPYILVYRRKRQSTAGSHTLRYYCRRGGSVLACGCMSKN